MRKSYSRGTVPDESTALAGCLFFRHSWKADVRIQKKAFITAGLKCVYNFAATTSACFALS